MSVDSSNRLNSTNLDLENLSRANYSFNDDSMEENDSAEERTMSRTAELAQNSIPNAGNNSMPNANADSDLSGRVAQMDSQGPPLLAIIAQVAKPLLTEYIPQALLISAGVAICVSVPATLGLGALGFVPLLFFGAMYLYKHPNADEIAAIEQQSEILQQRVGMLQRLDNLTQEIEKLEEEQDETGGSEALTAKIEATKMEQKKTEESLKNFDRHYGIDMSAGQNVENLGGSEEADESSGIENPNLGNVNRASLDEEEDSEVDESRLTQISSLREQMAQLSDEINLARGSKIATKDFNNLKSSLSNHKELLADLLRKEILATEEKAALLVDQEDEEERLYDSIERMQTEHDVLIQDLADEDYSDVDGDDFENNYADLVSEPVKVKQKPSYDRDEYEIVSDSDSD